MKSVATYCPSLRELSISYCPQLTDFVCYELSLELNSNLKYLSLAKCEQISDAGLKQIARHCYKLRYLNVRGCETISDSGKTTHPTTYFHFLVIT
jgi:F-box/leucine-rich repeat protein 7